jgi:histidinol phosphatase-like enzyme
VEKSETTQSVLLKIKLLSSLGFKPQLPAHNNTKPALYHENEHEKRGKYKGEQASTEPASPEISTRKPSDDEAEEEEEEIFLKIFQRTDLEIRKGYIERLSHGHISQMQIVQEKTSHQMRQEYLNRLVNMKILKLEPAKKHQTILIFDWDDTLLCTTFVKENEDFLLYESMLELLEALDQASSELISKATEYGEVFIITNADEGWVEESAKTFLPRVSEVLQEKKVKIISARKGYESRYPSEVGRWKMEAFLSIKRDFDSQVITNIICIGDQLTEIDAAYLLAEQFNRSIIKTIKFKERPKPDELVKEVKLVINKLESIYVALNHLKIRMEKKNTTCGGAK